MFNFLQLDSPFMQFLTKVANLIILNVLWLLCCVPVVTVGASTAAMYRVALQLARGTEESVIKPFFKAFRKDFWEATALFVILLLVGGFVVGNVMAALSWGTFFRVASYILLALFALTATYVFPLLAQFEDGVWRILKNAFIMSLMNLPKSMVAAAVSLIPVIILLTAESLFWNMLVIWLFVGIAAIAYIVSAVLIKVFDRYIECSEDDDVQEGPEQVEE